MQPVSSPSHSFNEAKKSCSFFTWNMWKDMKANAGWCFLNNEWNLVFTPLPRSTWLCQQGPKEIDLLYQIKSFQRKPFFSESNGTNMFLFQFLLDDTENNNNPVLLKSYCSLESIGLIFLNALKIIFLNCVILLLPKKIDQ